MRATQLGSATHIQIVILAERSECRDPWSHLRARSRHGALLTQRLAGMTFGADVTWVARMRAMTTGM
jgi:hypothetical protein